MSIQKSDKIFIAGHRGMVGSALVRSLEGAGFTKLITRDRKELDLCDSSAVTKFFAKEKPDVVILDAVRSQGRLRGSPEPVRDAPVIFQP